MSKIIFVSLFLDTIYMLMMSHNIHVPPHRLALLIDQKKQSQTWL